MVGKADMPMCNNINAAGKNVQGAIKREKKTIIWKKTSVLVLS